MDHCIRCGRLFDSELWSLDICPLCDAELTGIENEKHVSLKDTEEDLKINGDLLEDILDL